MLPGDPRYVTLVKSLISRDHAYRVATSKEIARVEKLWRLAQSPEPHEAASAREEMLKLMRRYGISEDEFGEVATEVVDDRRDRNRQAVAEFVGLACRCAAIFRARQIAFRGHAGRVARAAASYTAMVQAAEACADDPRIMGSPTPVREAWRLLAWMGFVDAIVERSKAMTKPEPPKPKGPPPRGGALPPEQKEEFVDTTAAQTDTALDQAARLGVGMDWLIKSAFELGKQVGAGVALKEESKPTVREPRGLLEAR